MSKKNVNKSKKIMMCVVYGRFFEIVIEAYVRFDIGHAHLMRSRQISEHFVNLFNKKLFKNNIFSHKNEKIETEYELMMCLTIAMKIISVIGFYFSPTNIFA